MTLCKILWDKNEDSQKILRNVKAFQISEPTLSTLICPCVVTFFFIFSPARVMHSLLLKNSFPVITSSSEGSQNNKIFKSRKPRQTQMSRGDLTYRILGENLPPFFRTGSQMNCLKTCGSPRFSPTLPRKKAFMDKKEDFGE